MLKKLHNFPASKLCFSLVLLISVMSFTACSDNSVSDVSEAAATQVNEQSISVSSTTIATPDEPVISTVEDNSKAVDFSSLQSTLKGYIAFARSDEKSNVFEYATECIVSLRDITGNENPEMIVGIKSDSPLYEGEYYFTTDDSGVPIYMGSCYGVYDEIYTDGEFIYAVREDEVESSNIMTVDKLEAPIDSAVSPDFADYQNTDALEFIYDTHMYFLRYDNEDWDSENQTWSAPEETAALFYCADSGLYEAYSVSKRMLELTQIEIGDFINRDGNLIYSYLPGENYIVSREEYEKIKSKTFEVLTKVNDEPVITSGWIDVNDINEWLHSLS